MDDQMNLLVETGVNLAALAIKGTVTAVNTKIKALKAEKDLETVRNTYDEIVNEILSEREEAIRIAQVYKNEVDRIVISDKDIEHLNKTIGNVLAIFKSVTPSMDISVIEQIQGLVNVDTLKAVQLLGFNFKAAIGEPLTTLCANAILSKAKVNIQPSSGNKKR